MLAFAEKKKKKVPTKCCKIVNKNLRKLVSMLLCLIEIMIITSTRRNKK